MRHAATGGAKAASITAYELCIVCSHSRMLPVPAAIGCLCVRGGILLSLYCGQPCAGACVGECFAVSPTVEPFISAIFWFSVTVSIVDCSAIADATQP